MIRSARVAQGARCDVRVIHGLRDIRGSSQSIVAYSTHADASLRPPFTAATALQKVKAAQHLWNTRDPAKVALAYTATHEPAQPDTIWRNRDQFLKGREEIVQFLAKKWEKEDGYRLRKELFAFTDNKIAVQFFYEWYEVKANGSKQWYRCYGLEDWTFAEDGLMRKRQMSGNDVAITEEERWFKDDVVDEDTVEISERHL
ncbi:DUF1348-domain-containing protein [Laetiporus sulphureus 93-53]|uniref:DUF1348-domain-containing protein n=1 Tax=Laetiporus sulphureus 93-53 TaxID=1314785 RepID=A0A165CX40_9APHY|nr:DUF1348-domain-containing protein [Laetiporus sulphureus 93-53]KZT03631.1 DUF1348-domain-containing protein [Laetiporus sulphureus 93-53]